MFIQDLDKISDLLNAIYITYCSELNLKINLFKKTVWDLGESSIIIHPIFAFETEVGTVLCSSFGESFHTVLWGMNIWNLDSGERLAIYKCMV